MSFLHGSPSIGDHVVVRRQRWTVSAVQLHADCALVTLAGAGAANALRSQRVIIPFETIEHLAASSRPHLVSIPCWRRLCRTHLAQELRPGSLARASRASIDLLPHQLEPALALLRGLGSRVLLADDVGLGKTVQAGLIVSELEAQGAIERVLVLTPAGLREQWAGEFETRFHLAPAIVDAADARRRTAELPGDVNFWSTVPLAIVSLDYAKRPEVLPALAACRWDLVLVDEAHNITLGTERFDAVHAIARLAPYVVLLTATPHNGDRRAFAALCSGGALPGDEPLMVFRRRRHEVGLGTSRRIHRVAVRPTPAERRMHDLLASFVRAVRRERGNRDADVRLALTVLHKRSLSSARSVALTVERRLAALRAPETEAARQLLLPLDDEGGELDAKDEAPALLMPLLADEHREYRLLTAIKDAADAASISESKIHRLVALLHRLHRRGHRAIVFTEYRDTLLHVRARLPFAAAVLHGGLARRERRAALEDFLSERTSLLLATDTAGEGLNLQTHCHIVINLELPWNPTRLEQRIGRVDRIGQEKTVHVWHLLASETGEIRLLDRLRSRLAGARAEFDVADPLMSQPSTDAAAVTAGQRSPQTSVLRLEAEARTECAALSGVRALHRSGGGDTRHAGRPGPAVAFARGRLRRWLRSRALVLFRSTIEDGAARPIAVHFTALVTTVDVTSSAWRSTVAGLLECGPHRLRTVDGSLIAWEQLALRYHAAIYRTRLAREEAILNTLRSRPEAGLQPGLFDRRAEREHAASTLEDTLLIDQIAARRTLTARAAGSHTLRVEPLLILLPPGGGSR